MLNDISQGALLMLRSTLALPLASVAAPGTRSPVAQAWLTEAVDGRLEALRLGKPGPPIVLPSLTGEDLSTARAFVVALALSATPTFLEMSASDQGVTYSPEPEERARLAEISQALLSLADALQDLADLAVETARFH